MRVRHAMAFATHKFFNDRGFLYIHTPIITGADCEGAGEQFGVSTLLPEEAEGEGNGNGHPSKGGGGPPMTPAGDVDYSKVGRGGRGDGGVAGGAKGGENDMFLIRYVPNRFLH